MFRGVLIRTRERLRNRQYIITAHARREMNEDLLTVYDIEHGILTGEILARQRDPETLESKYRRIKLDRKRRAHARPVLVAKFVA